MTTKGSAPTHPGLTIRVYRVDPETMEETPVCARTLPASDEAMMTVAYPPCGCERCSKTGSAR
ncbi:hypothetical protein ACFY3G_43320 [Streptomyces phaeochromogenes]|uniref:hypothetical protein n=1 Tax=Streptomyces phaeochromogenes TaxID=1923 RepID=UPI00368F04BF